MLSIAGILTLSSFDVKETSKKNVNVELQTWYYRCSDGTTGSFLMPRGSQRADALVVANAIC